MVFGGHLSQLSISVLHPPKPGAKEDQDLSLVSCSVDLGLGLVRRANATQELSTLECGLLRYLAERPGVEVSRSELQEHVWGHQGPKLGRAVDKTMNRLRKKVERDPAEPDHLVTVYGRGYRFQAARVVQFTSSILGREGVAAALQNALSAGGVVTLVGAPGMGKSTVLRAVAASAREAIVVPKGHGDLWERAAMMLGVHRGSTGAPSIGLVGSFRGLWVVDDEAVGHEELARLVERSPLSALLRSSRVHCDGDCVTLEGLDDEAAGVLVARESGLAEGSDTVARIVARAGGHPLWLIHLARQARLLGDVAAWELPSTIIDALALAWDDLGQTERDLISLVASTTAPIDVALLTSFGVSPRCVQEAHGAEWLDSVGPGQVAVSEMVREFVRNNAEAADTRLADAITKRVAELDLVPWSQDNAARQLIKQMGPHLPVALAVYPTDVGLWMAALHASRDGILHPSVVLKCDAGDDGWRLLVRGTLATSWTQSDGKADFERAFTILRAAGEHDAAAYCGDSLAFHAVVRRSFDEAMGWLQESGEPSHPILRARQIRLRGMVAQYEERPEEATRLLTQARALAQSHGSSALAAACGFYLARIYQREDKGEQAVDALQEILHDETVPANLWLAARTELSGVFMDAGRPRQALDEAAEVYARAKTSGQHLYVCLAAVFSAWSMIQIGEDPILWIRLARGVAASPAQKAHIHSLHAARLASRGRWPEAKAEAEQALSAGLHPVTDAPLVEALRGVLRGEAPPTPAGYRHGARFERWAILQA
jgi:DNA-binding winged helix-turn-helix (wHTH) protein/tetratricopeptide (TPR) repeat protein